MILDLCRPLALVRRNAPLVQCITNFVTVNDCANIILAAGGSPSYAGLARTILQMAALYVVAVS